MPLFLCYYYYYCFCWWTGMWTTLLSESAWPKTMANKLAHEVDKRIGTHSSCLKYGEEEAGRCRPLWGPTGGWRMKDVGGCRSVQACVSSRQPGPVGVPHILGEFSMGFWHSCGSMLWRQSYFCACPGTSHGRAYWTGGHMKTFAGHYNWIFQQMDRVANKIEEQTEAMQRSQGEQYGLTYKRSRNGRGIENWEQMIQQSGWTVIPASHWGSAARWKGLGIRQVWGAGDHSGGCPVSFKTGAWEEPEKNE